MKVTFSLLFYQKRPKTYQSGPVPVYLRITINGKRSEASTGRSCEPSRWNSHAGRALGTKEDARILNSYLDTLQAKVYEAHRALIAENQPLNAEAIRDRFLGKAEKPRFLLAIFREHNRKVAALVGKEFAKGTLERYETSLRHTRNFISWKYNSADLEIKKVDHDFISSYDFYLRSERHCGNNSAVKYLKNFKKIIRICQASGWLDRDPFVHYKARLKQVDRTFLSEAELQTMADKLFLTERLGQVRDIFLFCCFTGLAYADIKKLNRGEIITGIDGERWIVTKRQKTATPVRIPLLPSALAILEKYAEHLVCLNTGKAFPVSTNQKMNEYLKEIAGVCGITKSLTFHIARHTFATTVTLSNGVPIESVSKMLGHTNIRTTQHYAKILDTKVSEDMARLKQKLILLPK